jgi:hypothetical protein
MSPKPIGCQTSASSVPICYGSGAGSEQGGQRLLLNSIEPPGRWNRNHQDLVMVVSHATEISAGEWVTVSGQWVNGRDPGQQFKASRQCMATHFGLSHPIPVRPRGEVG